jgi:flagellar basal-body rod protein FlgB
MNKLIGGIFNKADSLGITSLTQRAQRSKVLYSNIANSETPGFRALDYNFEEQLQEIADSNESLSTSDSRHFRGKFAGATGDFEPDVHIRPTESIPQDGNTVDLDQEMTRMAENRILYDATVEMIRRKIGILRYAINGGR